MAEGIRDIDRIVTYKEKGIDEKTGKTKIIKSFKGSAIRIMGEDVYSQIRPALQHFVNPVLVGVDTPGKKAVQVLRSIAIPAHIALNTITGVKQVFSIPAGINAIGAEKGVTHGLSAYMEGVNYVVSNFSTAYNTMLEKSAFMKERLKSWERDLLKSRFDRMTPAEREFSFGDKNVTWEDVKDFAFITVRIPDLTAVTPLWWGAYLDKLNEFGTNEKAAVRFADNVIEDTQPIAQPLDLSAWFREPGYWGLFNLHQTWTIGIYGQRQRTWFRAWRRKEISNLEYARFNFMEGVMPMMLMSILISWLRGGDLGKPGLPWLLSAFNALTEGWGTPLEVAGAREVERWVGTARFMMRGFEGMNEKERERAMWGVLILYQTYQKCLCQE
jgi:hypothetical protein